MSLGLGMVQKSYLGDWYSLRKVSFEPGIVKEMSVEHGIVNENCLWNVV